MESKQKEIKEFFDEAKQEELDNMQFLRRMLRNENFENTLIANLHDEQKLEITEIKDGIYDVKVFACKVKISEGRCLKPDWIQWVNQ